MNLDFSLAKQLYEAGAPAVYIFFLMVVWRTMRADTIACKQQASDMIERYEALLRESVESLTRVAEALDDHDEKKNSRPS